MNQLVVDKSKEMIVIMEDHNQAYLAWKRANLKNKILVHLDAHIDFAWIQDRNPLEILEAESLKDLDKALKDRLSWNVGGKSDNELIGIGNYIYPAMKEEIVREFYWVIPDPIWENRLERKLVRKNIKDLLAANPLGKQQIFEAEDGSMLTEIYGKKTVVCSLSALPNFTQEVLLDIDVDFLVTASISGPNSHPEAIIPWIWPEELVNKLRQKDLKSDFITIAYSVEGGFTPLKYKYLGDDLKELLSGPSLDGVYKKTMTYKREAFIAALGAESEKAIEMFSQTIRLKPEDVSAHFNLSLLFYDKGLYDQAIAEYQKSINLDPTYKTAYNNYGPVFETQRFGKKAEKDYKKILKLDTNNANAYRGLGNVYVAKRRWQDAILNYNESIHLNGQSHKPHYNLGYVYAETGNIEKAIVEFEKSLTMNGANAQAYRWLGYLYFKKRRFQEAVRAYKKSLSLGIYSVTTHFRLCLLYMNLKNFYKAMDELKIALKILPKSFLLSLHFLKQRFIRRFSVNARVKQSSL